MIRLITGSTTDISFVHGKSDGIDQPNAIYFDKVKKQLGVCNYNGILLLYKVE
jgi:hypothetical protein